MWRCAQSNQYRKAVAGWIDEKDMRLAFDVKVRGTLHSNAWRRGYNPDRCFVTTNEGRSLPADKWVATDIPPIQHIPVILEIDMTVS